MSNYFSTLLSQMFSLSMLATSSFTAVEAIEAAEVVY